MTSTTNVVPTVIILADGKSLDTGTCKIPTERDAALALYAQAKRATQAAYDALPKSGPTYVKSMEAWQESFAFPTYLLWDRIVPLHQGGNGARKRTPSYSRWLSKVGH
jgi:hypothetical protein